ncbi:MAG: metallophosphoesterase family protein [Anaerolineales bacterium]|nr:metallophosphoesterase family protein [Anaerolineales bacterium]
MRIAILTDIHGNSLALGAALDEIEARGGVDEYWFLGDLVALGYDPIAVMQRLAALPKARFVRGNTDKYVLTGVHPGPPLEEIQNDLPRLEQRLRMTSSMSWTAGAVAASGYLPMLAALPLEMRAVLPDGTRALVVHAAPGTDDGNGIHPATTDAELRELLAGVDADLVLVGHTHLPFDRRLDGVRVVNPGSISNSFPPDLRAKYALLIADERGYSLEFCAAEYDREAVVEAVQRLRQPSAAYISRFMRGENKPGWMK